MTNMSRYRRCILTTAILLSMTHYLVAFRVETFSLRSPVVSSPPPPIASSSTEKTLLPSSRHWAARRNSEDEALNETKIQWFRWRRPFESLRRYWRPRGPRFVSTTAAVIGLATGSAGMIRPARAQPASDPVAHALAEHARRDAQRQRDEQDDVARRARELAASQGDSARQQFEREYQQQLINRAEEKANGLLELQRNLLQQGIDPFTDLEGRRQVTFYERGIDLGDVPGTPFYTEKHLERTNYKRSLAYQLSTHRKIIACMVRDMKHRGVDYLDYFARRPEQTAALLKLPLPRAQALLTTYTENLEKYGQITPLVASGGPAVGKKGTTREQQQRARKAEQARQKAEQQAAREAARLAKEQEKAAQVAARDAARHAKAATRSSSTRSKAKRVGTVAAGAVAGAAGVVSSAASGAAHAASHATDATAHTLQNALPELQAQVRPHQPNPVVEATEEREAFKSTPPVPVVIKKVPKSQSSKLKKVKTKTKSAVQNVADSKFPVVPVSAFLVAAGGGGYALKVFNDKKSVDEKERQRQLQLLMGMDKKENTTLGMAPGTVAPLEEIIADTTTVVKTPNGASVAAASKVTKPPAESATAAKKRRLGLKNVFSKKRNNRETDLRALVCSDAQAPEYATLLAKILTFGAPGRFPNVVSLPGGMPLAEFDLELAKEKLIDARAAASLRTEESAEIFANVVNCMLINIVDLASASLGENNEKLTVDAIDIVIDFMLHAASLYDSVAAGITIEPVTYGGDLAKSKLEAMYAIYAGSAMSDFANVREGLDDRAALLRDVFQISEKKAEGLMMKTLQKQMMETLKSGKGLEGLGDMEGLANMEGMQSMLGMEGAEDGEMSPSQVKEMLMALKQMKDSGTFSKEELGLIKKQFKESFGTSIDELGPNKPLNEEERELLDMMKSILED